jgi:hypothetical protein
VHEQAHAADPDHRGVRGERVDLALDEGDHAAPTRYSARTPLI